MIIHDIYYYTFIDPCINEYTLLNNNFIELTKTQNYFILTSGKIDGINYDEYLKGKNVKATYIHSLSNSYALKFNNLKRLLEENIGKYRNSIFCKIDTDLVHYRIKSFHSFLQVEFNEEKRIFLGNERGLHIRGALNAIHIDSILNCPYLKENPKINEFDNSFTSVLEKHSIILKKNVILFQKSNNIDKNLFAIHTITQGTKSIKCAEIIELNKKLNNEFLNIYV